MSFTAVEKNRNSDPIFQRIKLLRKVEVALEEFSRLHQQSPTTESDQALEKVIPTLLKKVKASIQDLIP